jgi:dihydrofolate synthase / folylpolyglutamate synthase
VSVRTAVNRRRAEPVWTYDRAIAALNRHVNLERVPGTERSAPKLERMIRLVSHLGDPQRRLRAVHLTGTNGKTSTAVMTAKLLTAAGMRVGLYTSPHLERINERMRIGDDPIDDELFAANVGRAVEVSDDLAPADQPNYFELLTAAAFSWFADEQVDAAVVEVGVLGRWDATNVLDAPVAVVTTLGADHLEYAGSLENVAREKAGIVKPGSTLVLGDTSPLTALFDGVPAARIWRRPTDFACDAWQATPEGAVTTLRTPGSCYADVALNVHGHHQADNAATALTAVEAFLGHPLPQDQAASGLAAVTTPGRMEVLGERPPVVIDMAHNPQAAAALVGSLAGSAPKWVLLYGALSGHDWRATLSELMALELDAVVLCRPDSPRAVAPEEIASFLSGRGVEAIVVCDVAEAADRAEKLARDGAGLVVTGSTYHLAAARTAILAPRQRRRAGS